MATEEQDVVAKKEVGTFSAEVADSQVVDSSSVQTLSSVYEIAHKGPQSLEERLAVVTSPKEGSKIIQEDVFMSQQVLSQESLSDGAPLSKEVNMSGFSVIDESSAEIKQKTSPVEEMTSQDEEGVYHTVSGGKETVKELIKTGARVPYYELPENSLQKISETISMNTLNQNSQPARQNEHGIHYTISGGPETLKELSKSNPSTASENPRSYPRLGTESFEDVTKDEEYQRAVRQRTQKETSLSSFIFALLFIVDSFFFIIIFGFPVVMEYLVSGGFFIPMSDGSYASPNGTISFTSQIPNIMLAYTLHVVLSSFGMLFLAGFVDHILGNIAPLFLKFLTFLLIALMIGVIFFLFVSGVIDVKSIMSV